MREMVEEADRNALLVIRDIRQAVKLADEHGDPGTVDLLSRLVQVHEKHEWWLRDMLRKGDGLCA
jgi:starvation-inducible DNA-binding protein